MKSATEYGWPGGWNPSASDKGDPSGQAQLSLLRADNLNPDETGIWRLNKANKLESTTQFPASDILGIFSATLNGIKTRFVFINNGPAKRSILATTTDPRAFNSILVNQVTEAAQRAAWLNALGQILMIAGGIQQKYDGTHNLPLGIAAPAAPTFTINATNTVDLSNLDGSGNYTNWTAVTDTTFSNSGTNVNGTAAAQPSNLSNVFAFTTAYGAPVDTTDLGGTGNDTPDDAFVFFFSTSDQSQLIWFKVQLFTDASNYFWFEWDFGVGASGLYPSFNVTSGVVTPVEMQRSAFYQLGGPDWTNINNCSIQIGISGTATVEFYDYQVNGGALSILTGVFNYVAVAVRDTGTFLEFSPASAPISVNALLQNNITLTPAGAVDAQATQYWLFRQDTDGGNYYFINSQTGAAGFSPAPYLDSNSLDSILAAANINPQYNLAYYRTALPANIIDMIYFRDRVVYLTTDSFIPSFKLDPGSYDSRFVYQLNGTVSESPLFIAKLNVGLFVIATTRDFYQVSGTFAVQVDPSDPSGNTQYLDVTITPLGVSDPAISHAFVEFQQTIIYMSSTGVRVLNNATSTLINDNLDLLFRNESRYDLAAIALLPFDQSPIAMVSQGSRIYFSLPHKDGINRIYVLNIANQTNAMYLDTRSWRLNSQGDNSLNPRSMCIEEDGTLIYGSLADPNNYVRSIENDAKATGYLPVKVRTPFNYISDITTRKDLLGFKLKVDTGNNIGSLVLRGLNYDGSFSSTTIQFSTQGNAILELDLKLQTLNGIPFSVGVPPAIAYSWELDCLTNWFIMEWCTYYVEPRPVGIRRAIVFSGPMDKPARKRIAMWPFVTDLLGLLSNNNTNLTLTMTVDKVIQPPQTIPPAINTTVAPYNNNGPATYAWECDPTKDLLGVDWQLEIVGDEEFEFVKFLAPIITQECPPTILQTIFPSNNFKSDGRKRLGVWPFRANLRSSTINIIIRVNGIALPIQTFTNSDEISTFGIIPPDDTIGIDFEMEINVVSGVGMEFYEFMEPVFTQEFPAIIHNTIQPSTNFGKPNLKKITVWPFVANTFNQPLRAVVKVDGVPQAVQTFTSNDIVTLSWRNNLDIYGMDWQLEVYCDTGMEFYKFLDPIMLQIFPIAKLIDQIGPLDFNAQGEVFGARFRIMGTQPITYTVYAGDVRVFQDVVVDSNTGAVPNMQDQTFIVTFAKGVNPTVCRMIITSPAIFYRFSVEYRVRVTGKETENKFVMMADVNAK